MVARILKTCLLLILPSIFYSIDYVLASSLVEKGTNGNYGDLCSSDPFEPDKGSCWCFYSNPVNISCSHVGYLEIITNAINQTSKTQDNSKLALQVNESSETIDQIVAWLTNGSYEEVFASLELLHLSWNGLTLVDLRFFTKLSNLKELDLSSNLIVSVIWVSLPSLTFLNLSHNRLTYISLNDALRNFPLLEKFDVSSNFLKSMDGLDQLKPNKLFSLYIHDNPLDCNNPSIVKLGGLIYSNRDPTKQGTNMIRQPWDILCSEPVKWKEMTVEQAYSVKQTSICHQCDCFMIKKDLLMVNCSYRDLTSLPKNLPLGARIVQLNGNRLRSFYLSAADSSSWSTVRAVYLDNNEISGLQDLEISKILRNLLSINLQRNQMKEVPIHILEQFSHLLKINLSENPWTCDCNTLTFQKWLQKHHEKVSDINKVYCTNSNNRMDFFITRNKERLPIHQLPISEICPQSNVPLHFLDILSGICAVLTILIALKAVYDYFWQKKTGKLPYFFKLNC
ncbi:protein singed wings 2 [Tetranychus urticae]|uniref:LRRCT domain-containing protein n=1 Tax=Tetranychus urticae TaxID=32264 RepID=T1K9S4_TETUR|nr:protein singed wings 2 [Tetranychus urticae]